MSNDTRVRVEFFSKIIASMWPASGASASACPWASRRALPCGRARRPASRRCASAPGVGQVEKVADAHVSLGRHLDSSGRPADSLSMHSAIWRLLDHQRRQHADDIVARRDRQQPVIVAQMRHERAAVGLHLDAQHQPLAAHAPRTDGRGWGSSARAPGAAARPFGATCSRNLVVGTTSSTACPPPSPAGCRHRSSRGCRSPCPRPPPRSPGRRRAGSRRRCPWRRP